MTLSLGIVSAEYAVAHGTPLTLDERMRVAYRIFRAMCALFRDRLITLLDPQGRIVARSDWPDSPFTLSDAHVTACPACAAQVILHRAALRASTNADLKATTSDARNAVPRFRASSTPTTTHRCSPLHEKALRNGASSASRVSAVFRQTDVALQPTITTLPELLRNWPEPLDSF